jgi:hypothetical protein
MVRQYLAALLDRERCACKLLDDGEVADELRGRGRTRRTRWLMATAASLLFTGTSPRANLGSREMRVR